MRVLNYKLNGKDCDIPVSKARINRALREVFNSYGIPNGVKVIQVLDSKGLLNIVIDSFWGEIEERLKPYIIHEMKGWKIYDERLENIK